MNEVLVSTYSNEMEARLMADRLKEEGIASVVKAKGEGYGISSLMSSFIPHSVYVLEEHAERARSLLEEA